jgi:ubiquinone/menaquinone biosynthesis C-methylase UbiE
MSNSQPENKSQGGSTFEQQRVCPWWCCFTFDNIFRRLVQNPERILRSYVKPGWTALDVGPGMGYYTIPMAKLVGNSGKVIAADLQKQMLEGVHRRALKAEVQDRVRLHLSKPDKIGIEEPIDFCLAFWMVHEVPDRARFLGEIASALKPGGLFLLVEPRGHVSKESFAGTVQIAKNAGLSVVEEPKIFWSFSALLKKDKK